MKTILKIFAGLFVLGLIMQAFKEEPKRDTSNANKSFKNTPLCVQTRAKVNMSESGLGGATEADYILLKRCYE